METTHEASIPYFHGEIDLISTGQKKTVKPKLDKTISVTARIRIHRGLEEGFHLGERIIRKEKNGQYYLQAVGMGTFTSETVTYKGCFHQNVFHDNSGNAEYVLKNEFRYVGSFCNGGLSGGKLEKYDPVSKTYYLFMEEVWSKNSVCEDSLDLPEYALRRYRQSMAIIETSLMGKIKISLRGRKKDVQAILDKQTPLIAKVSSTGEGGFYIGSGVVRREKYQSEYEFIPEGMGQFISGSMRYQGDFHEGLFHNVRSGMAECTLGVDKAKYIGEFSNGKRVGKGRLYILNPKTGKEDLFFYGTWRNDFPFEGEVYDSDGTVDYELKYPSQSFGEDEYRKHLGKVDEPPPLPINIVPFLKTKCPFNITGSYHHDYECLPMYNINQTHSLVYIPRTINGQPLTLRRLVEISNKSKSEKILKIDVEKDILEVYGDDAIEEPKWVLMRNNGTYKTGDEPDVDWLISSMHVGCREWCSSWGCKRTATDYRIPSMLETILASIARYFYDSRAYFHPFFCEDSRGEGEHRPFISFRYRTLYIQKLSSLPKKDRPVVEILGIRNLPYPFTTENRQGGGFSIPRARQRIGWLTVCKLQPDFPDYCLP